MNPSAPSTSPTRTATTTASRARGPRAARVPSDRYHQVKGGHVASHEISTLGGGCFWCLEAVFDDLEAVVSVESGYMGGTVKNPSYEEVCTGRTGHAEVVRVTFDPAAISYREILEV